ncbi:hypothetical protein AX774_g3597 [Zancudomyces culisetae]|uniref:Uncharacterized protein n=1 Tax=Zancudomyces culisetae TaxID=1213189 RepID=A0A1R1PPP2_ZANCU|nr:hypothetical protein AX774_g3597 [Zancudomyces culisetae]|eukprot:OMH82920.1 hypothetical protein AX774_g3597 [Zancudomyces culisetae]
MSKQILESVNPDLVVSGDDHDSCVVKQWNGEKLIEEHTVGAFGWASGIPRPAINAAARPDGHIQDVLVEFGWLDSDCVGSKYIYVQKAKC